MLPGHKRGQSHRQPLKTCQAMLGPEMVDVADQSKDAKEACHAVKKLGSRSGSITHSFERQGKGKVTYLHRWHTRTETKFVSCFAVYGLPNMPHVGRRLFIGSVKALIPSKLSRTGGFNHWWKPVDWITTYLCLQLYRMMFKWYLHTHARGLLSCYK